MSDESNDRDEFDAVAEQVVHARHSRTCGWMVDLGDFDNGAGYDTGPEAGHMADVMAAVLAKHLRAQHAKSTGGPWRGDCRGCWRPVEVPREGEPVGREARCWNCGTVHRVVECNGLHLRLEATR